MTPANKAAKTQAERRLEAENALLDAAEELIAEQGIVQTSLAQIGERAGYSRGLINHHFGTKDVLVERMVERARDKFLARFDLSPAENGYQTLCNTAEAYIKAYETPGEKSPALLVLWGAALTKQASHVKAIVESEISGREVATEMIRQGQADGSIIADLDAEASATTLLGMLRGVTANNLLCPNTVNWDGFRTEIRRYLKAIKA